MWIFLYLFLEMFIPNVEGRKESFLLLPDEVVINILSRLHPKDVLRCRSVVKKWRDLTSTSYFLDLHKQRRIGHVILADVPKRKVNQFQRVQYCINKWWITRPSIKKIHSLPPLYFSAFSQDGLLVITYPCNSRNETVIVNPIFGEKVKIVIPDSMEFFSRLNSMICIKVYGVYFNQTLKEHCVLLGVTRSSSVFTRVPLDELLSMPMVNPPITYKVLTLGNKPCLREIRNMDKDRSPTLKGMATHVDGFLYWLIHLGDNTYGDYGGIMEFNTTSDEFKKLMRCPAPVRSGYARFGLDLLNIDGLLSFVEVAQCQVGVDVNIWTLKDRASETWTSSHYHVNEEVFPPENSLEQFETIAVRCGKILIRYKERLRVCNLERGSVRTLHVRRLERRPSRFLGYRNGFSKFVSLDTCLTSLKNCKPVIHIGYRNKCLDCNRLDKEETSSSNSAGCKHADAVGEITVSGFDDGAGPSS